MIGTAEGLSILASLRRQLKIHRSPYDRGTGRWRDPESMKSMMERLQKEIKTEGKK